jgi:hepatocyte growth factor-regulated tyrosine kinase substrate
MTISDFLISRSDDVSGTNRHSTSIHHSRHRSARELDDAELRRAIQLSLEEAGVNGAFSHSGYVPSQPPPALEPPSIDRYPPSNTLDDEDDDPDLKAAIEASLREANAPKPSAPMPVENSSADVVDSYPPGFSQSSPLHATQVQEQNLALPNYDLTLLESDAIMTFSQTVEQVQTQGGRDITRHTALNQLYDQANNIRPKVVMSLDDTSKREREHFRILLLFCVLDHTP